MLAAHTRLGEISKARALESTALERARASGDAIALAYTLGQIALYNVESGDAARAIALNTEAATLARQVRDRMLEAHTLGNLGYNYTLLGLYRLARPALEQALCLTESIGERRLHAYALQNLGCTHLRSGDLLTARQLEEQALRELITVGDVYGRAACLYYLGLVAERAGDAPGAAGRFDEARKCLGDLEAHSFEMETAAGLARCALAQGQLAAAHQYVIALWQYLSEHGTGGMDSPTLCYLTCADIFDAQGDNENVRAAVKAGYSELLARAEKISDVAWRKSFLENVPDHCAIIELWERMT
jgi:tetratricopeptide (TPR) repeat protein